VTLLRTREQVSPEFSRLLLAARPGAMAPGACELAEYLQSACKKGTGENNEIQNADHHTRSRAIAIAITGSQATAIGQAQAPDRSLVGVWLVEITPRNCVTGEPILTAGSKALYTFHEDGTTSVSFGKQLIYARAYGGSWAVAAGPRLERVHVQVHSLPP
jgi:hypothetical protein